MDKTNNEKVNRWKGCKAVKVEMKKWVPSLFCRQELNAIRSAVFAATTKSLEGEIEIEIERES